MSFFIFKAAKITKNYLGIIIQQNISHFSENWYIKILTFSVRNKFHVQCKQCQSLFQSFKIIILQLSIYIRQTDALTSGRTDPMIHL